MKILLLYTALLSIGIVIVGLRQRKVTRNYFGPVYRDKNPISYWCYLFFYLAMAIGCMLTAFMARFADTDYIDYTYYDVVADNKLSLQENLKLNTPLHKNNKTYFSYTDWYVEWTFKFHLLANGHCRIKNLNVQLTATITLPKLIAANALQQNQFDSYLLKLKNIEMEHINIAKSAKYAIKNALSALSEMDSCDILNTTANNIAYKILHEYQLK